MATSDSSVKAQLKKLLTIECERRHQFCFNELQPLLDLLKKEQREEATGGEEATVEDLAKRLVAVDVDGTRLLEQCQEGLMTVLPEEVDKREKGTNSVMNEFSFCFTVQSQS